MRMLRSLVVVGLIAMPVRLVAVQSQKPDAGRAKQAIAGPQSCPVPGINSACATIWVTSRGEPELNGQPADLPQIEKAFRDLVDKQGVVVYAREAAEGEPHPTAMKVIELVVKHRLPVSMSTKRDFSDVLGPDGRPMPRRAG